MAVRTQRFAPCLWFDDEAEEAARFYVGVFPNSRLGQIARYCREGCDLNGLPRDSVMSVEFEIEGQRFTALNGGPHFSAPDHASFQVICDTQEEVDYYWERLGQGGDPLARHCGWLTDRFGVSWQVVPKELPTLIGDPASEASQRAMRALLRMEKILVGELRRACSGSAGPRTESGQPGARV